MKSNDKLIKDDIVISIYDGSIGIVSEDFINFLELKYSGLKIKKQKDKIINVNCQDLKRTFSDKLFMRIASSLIPKLLNDIKIYNNANYDIKKKMKY